MKKNFKFYIALFLLLLLGYVVGHSFHQYNKSFNLITHGWFLDAKEIIEIKGSWFKDEPTTIVCRSHLNLCVESTAGVVKGRHLMLDQYYWKVLRWDDVVVSKLYMPEVKDNLHWFLCINRKTKKVYKVDASSVHDEENFNINELKIVKTFE